MRLIPFTTKALTNIATNDTVDSIARLSRPSLVPARLCLRFTRNIATAMLLAPARRTPARDLSDPWCNRRVKALPGSTRYT